MRRELNRRFPSLQFGVPEPNTCPGTIDGVHGALTVAMLFGIPVEYYRDNWPAAQHAFLTDAQAARLEPPLLENAPVFVQILEQMDVIERAFGRIEGYLNWQGVLNTAFRLRGAAIFTDVLMNPGLARHVFEIVTETMIATVCRRLTNCGMKRVYARQQQSGVVVRHATVSNCVVNMVSPDLYREFLFPCDQKIAEAFDAFGVHNCAWNVDPYVEDYARLPKLGYIDMGLNSDLERARRLCPDARRAVMYSPKDLATRSLEQIETDMVRIRRELGPCDIVMADIDPEIPDARVLAFAELAACNQ
jgi:hypothetical protein